MKTMFYDKSRVAAAIGELVVGSDAQGDLAAILCDFITQRDQVVAYSGRDQLADKFVSDLHNLFRLVETCAEP